MEDSRLVYLLNFNVGSYLSVISQDAVFFNNVDLFEVPRKLSAKFYIL